MGAGAVLPLGLGERAVLRLLPAGGQTEAKAQQHEANQPGATFFHGRSSFLSDSIQREGAGFGGAFFFIIPCFSGGNSCDFPRGVEKCGKPPLPWTAGEVFGTLYRGWYRQ